MRNVTAGYGALTILSDVSVDVPAASVVGVIGESGCGKSTLARVVAGLTPLKEGEIHIDGKIAAPALKDRSRETLKDCQIVFQMADTALNPRQRIGDILGRPLAFYQGFGGARTGRKGWRPAGIVDCPANSYRVSPESFRAGRSNASILPAHWLPIPR